MGGELAAERSGPETPRVDLTPHTAMAAWGVSKAFGAAQALCDFDFSVDRGEIHALIGANGSGKSTFIKVLAGVHQADAGTLVLQDGDERDLRNHTSADAEEARLRFVHQDLGIFPGLSIAENLAIGGRYELGSGRRIKWRETARNARATLADFHVDADPHTKVSALSVPEQALLAIARSLHGIDDGQGAVLILDEPTASLPYDEAQLLFEVVKKVARRGHAVVFVTHRLDEVRAIADRVTGIRDGAAVGTSVSSTMSEADLVELILGRRLPSAAAQVASERSRGASSILVGRGLRGGPVQGVDIDVRAGEILGVAGLLGSGRTELLKLIFGALPLEEGDLIVDGETVSRMTPKRAREMGVAFVPEDRAGEAVIPNHDLNVNMSVGSQRQYFKRGWLRSRQLEADVDLDIERFTVKAQSPRIKIEALSGGNQQKVILARWLRHQPRLILLDEPTQGIDVGAREDIFRLLLDAACEGAGIVLVSSEFEELARLCDRVIVLREGRVVREHQGGVSGHELLESVLDRGEGGRE